MVKKAKKAKTTKKKKTTTHKLTVATLTPSAIKNKLGAKNFNLPPPAMAAEAATAGAASPVHTSGSAIIAPGPNGTTIICFFNENTGNFDKCQTMQGKVGLVSI